jgi:hypothetical protein
VLADSGTAALECSTATSRRSFFEIRGHMIDCWNLHIAGITYDGGYAGFTEIESRPISVSRRFESFDEFWAVSANSTAIRPMIGGMEPADADLLSSRVCASLPTDAAGRITYQATVNAIKESVPV